MTEVDRRGALVGGAAMVALASTARAAAVQHAGRAGVATAEIDPMSLVDPELRPFLEKALAPKPNAPPLLPRPQRYRPTGPVPPFAASPQVTERMIPGSSGQPPVKVYIIGRLEAGAKRPAILHIHGGGFVSGPATYSVAMLQKVSERLRVPIVTVDYRIAPETQYTGSIEDNYAALRWMHAQAAPLGIDPARIAVMGESAGGGHAAMLAITARDRGGPAICAQVLTYPMLDDRTGITRAVPPFIGTYVWQAEDDRYGWTALLGVPAGSARVPEHVVPARVQRLAGLPPAFIAVGSIDLFVEEDIDYARRLTLAGVPTDLHVYSGAFHGFDLLVPEASCSRAFEEARDRALRRAFA